MIERKREREDDREGERERLCKASPDTACLSRFYGREILEGKQADRDI